MLARKTALAVSLLAAGLALALGVAFTPQEARAGHTIKIGHTNPYSGPAAAYGTIGRVIKAYFEKINREGGINGHKVEFISYDDGYSPPKTVEQVRKLVEKDRVHMLFQTLGTPTNSAIHKYMNKKKVPHLFVATGATKWGQPKKYPWTMGWQPNYQTEAKIYAKWVVKNVPGAKIGVLYQNDDYGKDYLKGFKDGLAQGIRTAALGKDKAPRIVMEQSYEVQDPTIGSQIVNLKNSGANVFFNVTTPKAAAQSIKKVREIGWNPVHILNSVSTSVRSVLKPAGLEDSKGIVSAAYAKEPTDPQWKDDPATKAFFAFMNGDVPKSSRIPAFGVYAYSVTQTLVQVLKQCGGDLSRKNIMRQAANLKNLELPMLLPGVKINTSPTDFYPIEQMRLRRFDGKSWQNFGPLIGADEA
jgi:branched-chain amino acid transport system substrate-binding protein